MYKPISTKAHGVLDYLAVGTMFALPRAMGWSRGLTQGMTALALGKLGYTLCTRYELGLVKKLPMSAHLALDAAGGVALGLMPMLMGDEEDVGAQAACCTLATFEFLVAPLTETRLPFPVEETFEFREQTATAREHLENAGKERSILAGRPI
jgi:hypothetical protein